MPDTAEHIEKSPNAHRGVPARGQRTHFQRGLQFIARARFSAYCARSWGRAFFQFH